MFKVNNKNSRATSVRRTDFKHFSSVSIGDFKQVNDCWEV